MKNKFYTLFITLFLISGINLHAQTYNAHDLSRLKNFLEQSSGGKRNIDLLWAEAPETLSKDGSNWVEGVSNYFSWSGERLQSINARKIGLNGKLDFSECAGLNSIDLYASNLTSLNLKGCTSLKDLSVCINQIDEFNIDGCDNIETLSAASNQFKTFDASNKKKLRRLHLQNNKFTEINVKGCSKLEYLMFTKGFVTKLDLSDSPLLNELKCFGNKISSLDLSKNPELKKLELSATDAGGSYTNPLTSLNISGCQKLESYDFISSFTGLQSLNVSNCGLKALDLSKNTKLTQLEAGNQQLTAEKQEAVKGEIKLAPFNKSFAITPSDKGTYADGIITWSNVPFGDGTFNYGFAAELPSGAAGTPLSGTVSVAWHNNNPVSNLVVEENAPRIYSSNGTLYVESEIPNTVRVYNLTGQVVKQTGPVTAVSVSLSKGIYIVQLGNNTIKKVIVR